MTTTAETPGRLPVAIDGHPYLADLAGYQRQTVPVDGAVHRAARLRVRMEDHRDWRARPGTGVETAFEAALGAGKNDFGHELSTEVRDWAVRQVRSADGAYIG